jgi:o-succinylbenzoate synthase
MGVPARWPPLPSTPLSSWSALGASSALRVTDAEVYLVALEFRRPVATALGSHRHRPVALVRLLAEGPSGRVEGWGECAALADTTFDVEDADRAFTSLTEDLLPRFAAELAAQGGVLPGPASVADRVHPVGAPLAFAALEMAVADAHLRDEGRSFADLLGVPRGHPGSPPVVVGTADPALVPVGAVVGLADSVETLLAQVGALVDAGYARVKLKIGPGWDLEPGTALRRRFPDLILQVDGNGSYSGKDIGHLAQLDPLGLACIEQPFPRDDLKDHVALAGAMGTAVCLDESLDSPASVRSAIDMGACEVVCVKPARLGGLTAALEVYRDCSDAGVPMWLGGMFESGYARSVNTALAALPGFVLPGDLAPAADYLTEDLVPGPPVDRLSADGGLRVAVYGAPGMGPTPDPGVLARRTVSSWRWPAR